MGQVYPEVGVDLETTGVTTWWHEPTEIGATLLDEWHRPTACKFERKLIPDHPERADPEALRIGHFDVEVWKAEAVSQQQGLQEFADWLFQVSGGGITKPVLVGHNIAKFDLPMLTFWTEQRSIKLQASYIPVDTVGEFRRTHEMLTGKLPYKLNAAAMYDFCGVKNPAPHRAFPDAMSEALCYAILNQAVNILVDVGRGYEATTIINEAHYRLAWPMGHAIPNYQPLPVRS